MESLKALIDKGSELCGGQNALARKIGVSSTHMSKARLGKQPLSHLKLSKLADLVGHDLANLWELQEIANLPRRNPYMRE